jgi:hypothetical protein
MKKLICVFLCMALLTACGDSEPLAADDSPDTQITTTPPPPVEPPSEFEQRLATLEARQPRTELEIINYYHSAPVYELIPGDYGKLYPFPALAVDRHNILYGLMTADGRIVIDALFEFVWFVDIGDGYYRTHRYIPDEGWETRYIAADGSRELILPAVAQQSMLPDETIRTFEQRGEWEENWRDTYYTGILDMNGNIVSPFVHVDSHYAHVTITNAQYDHVLYMDRNTGEHFVFFHGTFWSSSEGDEYIIESAVINERGEVEARFAFTPSIYSRWFITDNITLAIGDYIVIRDPNGEDEVRDFGDWEHVIPHQSVVLTDRAGNVLLTFPDGVNIHGSLINCVQSGKTYDMDLNELDFGEYTSLVRHIEDDIYIFKTPSYWDENDTWVSDDRMLIVNMANGVRVETQDVHFNTLQPVSSGVFIGNGMLIDLNIGTIESFLPEGFSSAWVWEARPSDNYQTVSIGRTGSAGDIVFYGLYTFEGEEVLPVIYDKLSYIGDGLFEVMHDDYMGVINSSGEWLVKIDMLKNRAD